MFLHYIRIAFRNIFKTGLHSFINILGLSTGIACAVLVIFFVRDEVTFDQFHEKSGRIYRLYYNAERLDGSLVTNTVTPLVSARQLEENFSEIEKKASWMQNSFTVEHGEEAFEQQVNMTTPAFFDIFSFPMKAGSVNGIFQNPSDAVITESTAIKYFGKVDATGETLAIMMGDNRKLFEVVAVTEDPPSNSSIQFEILIWEEVMTEVFPRELFESWNLVMAENYLLLSEGVSPDDLEAKLPAFVESQIGEQQEGRLYELKLQPIEDIHLNSDMPAGIAPVSDPKFTSILTAIALLVLLMAGINFVNLSLGRSFGRAREIGIKKVVGAQRSVLIIQFLGEALIIAFISLFFGLLISWLALPVFNELSGKSLEFILSPGTVGIILLLTLLVGTLAGLYPAFVLSGFRPIRVLRGGINIGGGKNTVRKVMLTVQLLVSAFLITSAIMMKDQISFMRNKNLGFNQEQLVVFELSVPQGGGFRALMDEGMKKGSLALNRLRNLPNIEEATLTAHTFEEGGWMQLGYSDENQVIHEFHYNAVEANYIKTTGMKIREGRDFQMNNEADKRRAIIVNEAFVREFGLEQPVGSRIPHDEFADHEIIGVVEDFHFSSLHEEIAPAVISQNPGLIFQGINNLSVNSSFVPKVMARISTGKSVKSIARIREIWNEVYPGDPFDYAFVDESIDKQYEQDRNAEKVVQSATAIATLIGALGLFGLVTLSLSSRMKELSIRKLLGADIGHMLFTMSRDFLILVLVATILSTPLTWLFIQQWLTDFQFRITPGPYHFLLGGIALFIIAVISMSYQSIRVLKSRPVDELRRE